MKKIYSGLINFALDIGNLTHTPPHDSSELELSPRLVLPSKILDFHSSQPADHAKLPVGMQTIFCLFFF